MELVTGILMFQTIITVLHLALFLSSKGAVEPAPVAPPPLPNHSVPKPSKRRVIANDDARAYRLEVEEQKKAELS